MRRQLIEALSYPHLLIQQLIEEGNFAYDSFYEVIGERCNACDGGSCGWDKCFGDFSHRDDKTTEELSASLREGIRLVEAMHSKLRHDETSCRCETCTWIRNAEHLTEECEHHLPHVEPDLHNYLEAK
ncbi:MAG: hypothetical protein ACE5F8_00035 [Woeseiaceae bacterium]